MEKDEERIRQEDCSEDYFGAGVLTITNKRLAFDKTKGRIIDFSKKFGDTVIDVPIKDIIDAGKEGWLVKKVWIRANTKDGEKTFKFGVFNTRSWLETIQEITEKEK